MATTRIYSFSKAEYSASGETESGIYSDKGQKIGDAPSVRVGDTFLGYNQSTHQHATFKLSGEDNIVSIGGADFVTNSESVGRLGNALNTAIPVLGSSLGLGSIPSLFSDADKPALTLDLTNAKDGATLMLDPQIAAKLGPTPIYIEEIENGEHGSKNLVVSLRGVNNEIIGRMNMTAPASFFDPKNPKALIKNIAVGSPGEEGSSLIIESGAAALTGADVLTAQKSPEKDLGVMVDRELPGVQKFQAEGLVPAEGSKAFDFLSFFRNETSRNATMGALGAAAPTIAGAEKPVSAADRLGIEPEAIEVQPVDLDVTKKRFLAFVNGMEGKTMDEKLNHALEKLALAGPGRVANLDPKQFGDKDYESLAGLMDDYTRTHTKDVAMQKANAAVAPEPVYAEIDPTHVEPKNALVQRLQAGILHKNPDALPQHGADGRRGKETGEVLQAWAKENKVDLGDLSNDAIAAAFEKSDALKELATKGDAYLAAHKPKQQANERHASTKKPAVVAPAADEPATVASLSDDAKKSALTIGASAKIPTYTDFDGTERVALTPEERMKSVKQTFQKMQGVEVKDFASNQETRTPGISKELILASNKSLGPNI